MRGSSLGAVLSVLTLGWTLARPTEASPLINRADGEPSNQPARAAIRSPEAQERAVHWVTDQMFGSALEVPLDPQLRGSGASDVGPDPLVPLHISLFFDATDSDPAFRLEMVDHVPGGVDTPEGNQLAIRGLVVSLSQQKLRPALSAPGMKRKAAVRSRYVRVTNQQLMDPVTGQGIAFDVWAAGLKAAVAKDTMSPDYFYESSSFATCVMRRIYADYPVKPARRAKLWSVAAAATFLTRFQPIVTMFYEQEPDVFGATEDLSSSGESSGPSSGVPMLRRREFALIKTIDYQGNIAVPQFVQDEVVSHPMNFPDQYSLMTPAQRMVLQSPPLPFPINPWERGARGEEYPPKEAAARLATEKNIHAVRKAASSMYKMNWAKAKKEKEAATQAKGGVRKPPSRGPGGRPLYRLLPPVLRVVPPTSDPPSESSGAAEASVFIEPESGLAPIDEGGPSRPARPWPPIPAPPFLWGASVAARPSSSLAQPPTPPPPATERPVTALTPIHFTDPPPPLQAGSAPAPAPATLSLLDLPAPAPEGASVSQFEPWTVADTLDFFGAADDFLYGPAISLDDALMRDILLGDLPSDDELRLGLPTSGTAQSRGSSGSSSVQIGNAAPRISIADLLAPSEGGPPGSEVLPSAPRDPDDAIAAYLRYVGPQWDENRPAPPTDTAAARFFWGMPQDER